MTHQKPRYKIPQQPHRAIFDCYCGDPTHPARSLAALADLRLNEDQPDEVRQLIRDARRIVDTASEAHL